MILVPTKIRFIVESTETDYMGLTTGSKKITEDGYYNRATVRLNLNSINGEDSRFDCEEEGVISIGVHESIHVTDTEQINIDRNRDFAAEEKDHSLYWINEEKPMNAEYNARSEYRDQMQMENTQWKVIYESDHDSKGCSKPVFDGVGSLVHE